MLSALDHRAIIDSNEALTNRYYYRHDVDKYNKAIQKDILMNLTRMFRDDFCKKDLHTYKNAKSRADGQKLILKTMDVFRDPEKQIDAWIEQRMFAYMRLAAGEFGWGNIEGGYAALEKSVDLYIQCEELPNGTKLQDNCSALDMLSHVIDKTRGNTCQSALRYLTVPQGWEWFNGVRSEERYRSRWNG